MSNALQNLPPFPEPVPNQYFIDGRTVDLSEDQILVRDTILSGRNVFLTGEPGTGKSVLTKVLKYEFAKQRKSMVVLAPTGIAALNVGGSTIHKFFKFKIDPLEPYYGDSMGRSFRMRELIRATDVLLIDEISMVRSDVFVAIDKAMRASMSAPDKPFGGKQVILVGDFFQLPPVVSDPNLYPWLDQFFGGRAAYNTASWIDGNFECMGLTQMHRQTGDPMFINALRYIRNRDHQGFGMINQMCRVTPDLEGTIIVFTRDAARVINSRRLNELDTKPFTFVAEIEKGAVAPVDAEITLKVGARVILMANTDAFVNGDMGEVIELRTETIVVKLDRGHRIEVCRHVWEQKEYVVATDGQITEKGGAKFAQFPLALGWAITAHKSQGQTLDKVTLLLDTRPFEPGQLYVALSRVRRAEDLLLGRPLDNFDMV